MNDRNDHKEMLSFTPMTVIQCGNQRDTYVANSKKPKGPETTYFVSSLQAKDCPWLRAASGSSGRCKSDTARDVQTVGGNWSKFMVSYWLSWYRIRVKHGRCLQSYDFATRLRSSTSFIHHIFPHELRIQHASAKSKYRQKPKS